MNTYEWGTGESPEGAPVRWRERTPGNDFIIEFDVVGSTRGFAATFHTMGNASDVSDAICRAFHIAKLAEDYVRACDRSDALRESDPFIETAEGIARAKVCDAAHSALREATR